MKHLLFFLSLIGVAPLAYGDGFIRSDSDKMMSPGYTIDTSGINHTMPDKMDVYFQNMQQQSQLKAMKDVIKAQQSEIDEIKARLDSMDKKINSEDK